MDRVRRRAWWYLVALSALLAVFGAVDIAAGATADPGIAEGLTGMSLADIATQDPVGYRLFDFFTRTQGVLLVAFGVMMLVVLWIPYRAGHRWAWWATWVLPAWAGTAAIAYLVAGIDATRPPPPPLISGPILGALAVVALLLDRPRFRGRDSSGA